MRWLMIADAGSIHARRFATALAGAGADLHLASYRCPAISGMKTHDLGERPARNPLRVAAVIHRIRDLARALSPDVVNPHFVTGYGLLAGAALQRRTIQTAWGSDILHHAKGLRRVEVMLALRQAWMGMGDSAAVRDAIGVLAPRLPLTSFHWGPPAWVFDAPRPKERLIVSPRLHHDFYRIDVILDAWERARERLDGYRLIVADEGPLTSSLRRRAGEGVEFVGRLAHDDLLRLFLRAETVVTIPRWDSTSASVLEAMAAGCRVIASDVPAVREWLPAASIAHADVTALELADMMVAAPAVDPMSLDRKWCIDAQAAALLDHVEARLR